MSHRSSVLRPPRPLGRAVRVLVAVATLSALLAGCGEDGPAVPRGVSVDSSTPADLQFTIPKGASKAGAAAAVLPSPIVLRVGQVIRVVNEDDVGYDLGTFYVGARETMTRRATRPGTYTSACTLHPSGTITLTITA